jgi:excisionase family DNA binding protein
MYKHLQEPLLTRREVAEALGVSVQTVARLIGRGELETVRVGERFVRIPAESLEQYLQAQEKGGAE